MLQSKASEKEKLNTIYGQEICDMSKTHIMYITF
jgi:hypothetical protein